MTFEADLTTLLKTLCQQVYPDVAPVSTPKPYITYQFLGGRALRWLDLTASDKRHTLLQVNCWAATRLAANQLARQVEDALCAATVFKAWPDAEPIGTHDGITLPDTPDGLYGCIQDFGVYSART